MNFNTIESQYDYRIANILRQYVQDAEIDLETTSPSEVFEMLWKDTKELGRLLHDDMLVWMSEEDWIKAVQEN